MIGELRADVPLLEQALDRVRGKREIEGRIRSAIAALRAKSPGAL